MKNFKLVSFRDNYCGNVSSEQCVVDSKNIIMVRNRKRVNLMVKLRIKIFLDYSQCTLCLLVHLIIHFIYVPTNNVVSFAHLSYRLLNLPDLIVNVSLYYFEHV